jgi:hydrophobe/amphiphile efflux-1 (HAE1) family protein
MNLGRLSIERPILAIVLSIFILIVGAIAYTTLPVTEYPEIAPPTIVVQARYPGASAQTAADTVATPIEQEVNGVENMLYMYSQSTGDGRVTLTVTFRHGTDLDEAQVLVQNRVAIAEPRLPEEVRRGGITTRKSSPDLLMVVFLLSPDDTYDQLYISNYALRRVRDELLRLDGVGDITIFGARDYSMRVWLDPDKTAELGMTAGEVVQAIRAQNVQIAGGQIAEPPIEQRAFQPSLNFVGRLSDPEAFESIIVKSSSDGRIVRLRDVARVELGALSYSTNAVLLRKPTVALAISQRPGSNALATAQRVQDTVARLSQSFPKGLAYNVAYNPTEFIDESVSELIKSIFEAVILVVVVVLLFLQRWRAAIIPIIAIPVSLVGTFGVMAALGFSINNLTLFGLVLAVGIVVDDAIVVVENVERHLANGLAPREAAMRTMGEVGGALISIALVLCAVFIPTAFLTGITGQFFRQFAVTIAVATAISAFNSLTLSPALASMLLQPHGTHGAGRRSLPARMVQRFFDAFNRAFDRSAALYGDVVRAISSIRVIMLGAFALLIGLTVWTLVSTPQGFIPQQDRGYLIVSVQLPGGASLARTTAVLKRVEEAVLATPGVVRAAVFAGFSGATRTISSSAGALFPVFAPYEERLQQGLTAQAIAGELRKRLGEIDEAFIVVIPPPPVPGIGTGGGFAARVQDLDGRGTEALAAATSSLVDAARANRALTSVFSPFSVDVPQLFVEVDRTRAEMLNVPVARVTEAIETYFGSAYVNDFNTLGRTYRVTAQADLPFRTQPEDLMRLRT